MAKFPHSKSLLQFSPEHDKDFHNYNASKNIQKFKVRNTTFALRVCSIS